MPVPFNVMLRRSIVADAACERSQQTPRHPRIIDHQPSQGVVVQDETTHRRLGDNRGDSWSGVDHRHLTEERTGGKSGDRSALTDDPRRPLYDDEQCLGMPALSNDDGTCFIAIFDRAPCDLPQLSRVQVGEERDT